MMSFLEVFPPYLWCFFASLICLFLKEKNLRNSFALVACLATLTQLVLLYQQPPSEREPLIFGFLDLKVYLVHLDSLSFPFAVIFAIAGTLGVLFGWEVCCHKEISWGLLYMGGAIATIVAGDLITLYVFWELIAVAATFVLFSRNRKRSREAAIRYLIFHVIGGFILLVGLVGHIYESGTTQFTSIALESIWSYLIFIGFGINCAWPAVHTWLVDAYPEAGIAGILFMATFTTKTALYALARGFAGEPALIYIGTAMAIFPIFYAVIENNMRRVLSYSLINQVGFMVIGVGLGGTLGLNGAVAHAITDILFKGLLFMAVGAVIFRTGKELATELGGLYKYMPWTCFFCLIGAASISAFPLFSGFVSKSMIVTEVAEHHLVAVWFVLIFASAGVLEHAGIKIPFFVFFGHDSGLRPKEAPFSMLLAMGLSALGCILIGCFPQQLLYPFLPVQEGFSYNPYTFEHIYIQIELLAFSALSVFLLLLAGIYPAEIRSVNLDMDFFSRRATSYIFRFNRWISQSSNQFGDKLFLQVLRSKAGDILKKGWLLGFDLLLPLIRKLPNYDPGETYVYKKRIEKRYRNDLFPVGIWLWALLVTAFMLIYSLVL